MRRVKALFLLLKKHHRKYLVMLAVLAAAVVGLLFFARHEAANIFNRIAAEQDMLRGTVEVETLSANLSGEVTFTNLTWKDGDGNTLLTAPEGSFRVSLWDVLRAHFTSETVTELTLTGPRFVIYLDENMKGDIVQAQEPPQRGVPVDEEARKEEGEKRRLRQARELEHQLRNLNVDGHPVNLDLHIEKARVEIVYPKRHYVLHGVELNSRIRTQGKTELQLRAVDLGGTMDGRAVSLDGTIRFGKDAPEVDLRLRLVDVDLSSMGFGGDIHDKLTLALHLVGELKNPQGEGEVLMEELRIPGLEFQKVHGLLTYAGGVFKFTDVTADVFGGKLTAYGDYDLDSRFYRICGHGTALKAGQALKGSKLKTDVDMDISFTSAGDKYHTVAEGRFVSGEGTYHLIPFRSLSGSFTNAYRELVFSDVEIDFDGHRATTPGFSIVDGKLTMQPVSLWDDAGNLVIVYQR